MHELNDLKQTYGWGIPNCLENSCLDTSFQQISHSTEPVPLTFTNAIVTWYSIAGAVKLYPLNWQDIMKGLIHFVCIVFGLCIFALETHGQPVPDYDDDGVSDPVPDQDDGALTEATTQDDQDDGITETAVSIGILNPCTK